MPVNGGWYNLKTMYCGTYAPWEHYPKTLRHEEMTEPLSVVADFFSCDSVKGHGKQLKEWRHYVINDESYPGDRHGPGNLLFDYDMNLKLLEAVYLLFCHYQNYSYQRKEITDEQLANEKEQWEYFPKRLSDSELREPFKAVKKVFKKISPQQYRDYLHEWLHSSLYVKADTEGLNSNEVIDVYDNLRKLYSAAWVIFQRESDNPRFKRRKQEPLLSDITPEVFEIRGIDPNPTAAEAMGLEEVKNLILKRFSSVEMIIHLGTHREPFTYYLLILMNDEDDTPEHEISNKIEDHCRYLGHIHAIVHKSNSAKVGLNIGKRFWCKAISQGNILYQAGNLALPECAEITKDVLLERAKFHWERWGVQAGEFLKGAEYYRMNNNYRLAAFLLHQAVEGIFKAMLQSILGYRVQMHNLSRLLRLILLINDDLRKVFKLDTKEGIQLFALLQRSYSDSRYNNVFDPDEESVKLLAVRVEAVCGVAEGICKQYISSLQTPVLG